MRRTLKVAMAVTLGACAGKPAPTPTPRPVTTDREAAALFLADNWSARVQLDRSDSIVLSLPGGGNQLQRLRRHASFTLTVGPRAAVTLRLDTLTMTPSPGRASIPMVGTIWTGRLLGNGVDWLSTAGSGPVVEELSGDIEGFFPRLPSSGIRAGATWADTSTTKGRIDIFEATRQLTSRWTAGRDSSVSGQIILPVHSRGVVEQAGKGSEGGMEMSMTGQGSRSYTYYLLKNGQVSRVARTDSLDVLISIPSSHQIVPTVRFIRSQVTFSPHQRDAGH